MKYCSASKKELLGDLEFYHEGISEKILILCDYSHGRKFRMLAKSNYKRDRDMDKNIYVKLS